MPNIVTLTVNPTIDKTSSVERVEPESKLRCSKPTHEPGGGGINVARAIHQLEGDVTAWWTCGGVIGELLEGLLEKEGVENRPLLIEDMTRENLIVDERCSGKQYRFGMPGPTLTEAEVRQIFHLLENIQPVPDFLVLSGSLPPGSGDDFYAQVARRMPEPCRVVVDTSGPALQKVLEASLFLIKPNLKELGQLAGREIQSDAEIEEVSRELIEAGKAQVVVTSLGSGGAVVVAEGTAEHVRTPTVPIRSKVGAGDCTVAGIVLGLAQGKSIAEAVRFGMAAGAAAVMTPGSTLCRRDDVHQLYQQTQ